MMDTLGYTATNGLSVGGEVLLMMDTHSGGILLLLLYFL